MEATNPTGWMLTPQFPQDSADVLSRIRQAISYLENPGNLSQLQPLFPATLLRQGANNKRLVVALRRIESSMDAANHSEQLRTLIFHYKSDEPLYPSDEVTLHISVRQVMRELLVLWSQEGRILPSYPKYPLAPEVV